MRHERMATEYTQLANASNRRSRASLTQPAKGRAHSRRSTPTRRAPKPITPTGCAAPASCDRRSKDCRSRSRTCSTWRRRDARRIEDPRQCRAGATRRAGGGATARGRRRDRRPHEHGRVRVRRESARTRTTARRRIRSIVRRGRIPGGSSSGAAVAVADDMCAMALGTRYARLGARAGRAVRRHRIQTDRAARAARRRVSVVVHARFGGSARQIGRELRRVRCSAGGGTRTQH